MAEIHINVGIAALARGFITLEAFAQGMQSLASTRTQSVQDLWIGQGLMDAGQLETVLAMIGTSRDTMLFAADSRSAVPAEVGPDPTAQIGRMAKGKRPFPQGPATAPTAPSLIPPPPSQAPATVLVSSLQPQAPEIPSTATVAGRYKRLFTLGTGGLGEVEACEDLLLGRTVAVKAGHQKGEVDHYSAKLILAREARIISCLEHPNIIPIYDAGTDDARGPFYVMRQVTDTSLEMILHLHCKTGEGDPSARLTRCSRLLRYFLQVCLARVDYAHCSPRR